MLHGMPVPVDPAVGLLSYDEFNHKGTHQSAIVNFMDHTLLGTLPLYLVIVPSLLFPTSFPEHKWR